MNLLKILATTSQSTQTPLFYQSMYLIQLDDGNIALNGRVLSPVSLVGYSNDSSTDQVVFKMNQNGNILWTTALDFRLGYDAASEMTSYANIIYSGMYANLLYPWVFSLNGTDGGYLLSNWFTFFFNTTGDTLGNYYSLILFRIKSWICYREIFILVCLLTYSSR